MLTARGPRGTASDGAGALTSCGSRGTNSDSDGVGALALTACEARGIDSHAAATSDWGGRVLTAHAGVLICQTWQTRPLVGLGPCPVPLRVDPPAWPLLWQPLPTRPRAVRTMPNSKSGPDGTKLESGDASGRQSGSQERPWPRGSRMVAAPSLSASGPSRNGPETRGAGRRRLRLRPLRLEPARPSRVTRSTRKGRLLTPVTTRAADPVRGLQLYLSSDSK